MKPPEDIGPIEPADQRTISEEGRKAILNQAAEMRELVGRLERERDRETDLRREAERRGYVPCPDADVCKRCPAAAEDDVCFPCERAAAERDNVQSAHFDALEKAERLLAQRNAAYEELVEHWHAQHVGGTSLPEFMGITQTEYAAWVEDPNT